MLLNSKGFSVIRGWIQVLLVADRHHTRKTRRKNLILLTDSKPCCALLTEPHTSEFISPLRMTNRSARNERVKKNQEKYEWSQQQDMTHLKLVTSQKKWGWSRGRGERVNVHNTPLFNSLKRDFSLPLLGCWWLQGVDPFEFMLRSHISYHNSLWFVRFSSDATNTVHQSVLESRLRSTMSGMSLVVQCLGEMT